MSSFIEPVAIDAHTLLYRPPADVCAEFEVTMTTLPVGTASYSPMMRDCASIVIVTRGSGVATCAETEVALRPGVVLFLGANKEMKVNTAGSSEDLVFFRAHVNLGQRVD